MSNPREIFEKIKAHPDMKDYKDLNSYADSQRLWLISYSDWQQKRIKELEDNIIWAVNHYKIVTTDGIFEQLKYALKEKT